MTTAMQKKWNDEKPSAMTEEALDKWIEALESEQFGQATGQLCTGADDDERGYCCLGVFAVLNGVDMDKNEEGLTDCIDSVRETAGLAGGTSPYDAPAVVQASLPEATATSLAELNDGGWAFADIARVLRGERAALLKGEELYESDLEAEYDPNYDGGGDW